MGLLAGKVTRLCHLSSQVSPICESPSPSAPGHLQCGQSSAAGQGRLNVTTSTHAAYQELWPAFFPFKPIFPISTPFNARKFIKHVSQSKKINALFQVQLGE